MSIKSLILSICKKRNYIKVYTLYKNKSFKAVFDLILQKIIEKSSKHKNSNFTYNRNYKNWIKLYDQLNDNDLNKMKIKISEFKNNPKISIIMPTFNSNIHFLKEAINSVQKQIYENWELCIADDCSTNSEVLNLLNYYKNQDKRIKIVFRKENGNISAASNTALNISTGDWIALLDHDDVIKADALYWVVKEINLHPQAKMIYSDEDKLDENENRKDPYFKCDFNKHLFYSQNMFCHLGVFISSLVKECKGFRLGFEGCQDYDLILRCLEKVEQSQIRHIPKILYHWRAHKNSTAYSISSKSYAVINSKKAIDEYFRRKNIKAYVDITDFGYRTRYLIPKIEPKISIIILTKNKYSFFKKCFESITNKTLYKNYEFIIIDNNSDEPEILEYLLKISKYRNVKVIKDNREFNFSQLNNSAVKYANSEYLLFLNNDIEVISAEWLTEMVSFIIQPNIAIVGSKLLYPDNKVQHAGVIVGIGGVAGHSHKYYDTNDPGYFSRLNLVQNLSAVTGACLLTKRSVFEEVGGFDENLKIAFNDVDYCLKVTKKNYEIIYTPYAELYHHESITRGANNSPLKIEIHNKEVHFMLSKWKNTLEYDPYYSINLTIDNEDFSYAFPPRTKDINNHENRTFNL